MDHTKIDQLHLASPRWELSVCDLRFVVALSVRWQTNFVCACIGEAIQLYPYQEIFDKFYFSGEPQPVGLGILVIFREEDRWSEFIFVLVISARKQCTYRVWPSLEPIHHLQWVDWVFGGFRFGGFYQDSQVEKTAGCLSLRKRVGTTLQSHNSKLLISGMCSLGIEPVTNIANSSAITNCAMPES